jgi:hypothetical protein
MGNTSSSKDRASEEMVDFGYLAPQGGIYPSAARDWNQAIVSQLIVHRKLSPFYRPLEDYQEDWDDERILASQKRPSPQDGIPAPDEAGGAGVSAGHNATIGASASVMMVLVLTRGRHRRRRRRQPLSLMLLTYKARRQHYDMLLLESPPLVLVKRIRSRNVI